MCPAPHRVNLGNVRRGLPGGEVVLSATTPPVRTNVYAVAESFGVLSCMVRVSCSKATARHTISSSVEDDEDTQGGVMKTNKELSW